ncbi:MAG: sigma-70 family RNA polymerase sigma factor, partial [Clostridia bacterium]|nr:sigma-70 family RNA polymerase sigma factor [Clostridia bacterium]
KDDLEQEARCGITKAIETYDPTRNDNFVAYAVLCIKSALLSAVRQDSRQKSRVINRAVELSDEWGQAVDSAEKVVLRQQEISDVNKKISRALSPRERQVLLLFADGYTYAEIAEALGLDTKAVDNALTRARAKLQS